MCMPLITRLGHQYQHRGPQSTSQQYANTLQLALQLSSESLCFMNIFLHADWRLCAHLQGAVVGVALKGPGRERQQKCECNSVLK